LKTASNFIALFFLFSVRNFSLVGQTVFDMESGLVTTGYNDVRIPSNGGTLFSLKDDFNVRSSFFYRLRLTQIIKPRHTLSLLYAPLEIKSMGSQSKAIFFNGVNFEASTAIWSKYKFNSYRLTYRYDFIFKPQLLFGMGLTAKIRDASIRLLSENSSSEKTSLGFVPIINFNLRGMIDERFGFLLQGDALLAPQGRAEDIHAAVTYQIDESIRIRGGYRILEGGAKNDKVYGFSLFHYAAFGVSYAFKKKLKVSDTPE
jgi:hypothetical protein